MIELTRLNGERMIVNSDLIRYAEASPDTVITLITGDKIVVTETPDQVIKRVVAFRIQLLQGAFPGGGPVLMEASQAGAMVAATGVAIASQAVTPAATPPPGRDESWRRRRRLED